MLSQVLSMTLCVWGVTHWVSNGIGAFALSIGMDRTYYASVESGKRNISLENIKKIADGFGISLSQLFINL